MFTSSHIIVDEPTFIVGDFNTLLQIPELHTPETLLWISIFFIYVISFNVHTASEESIVTSILQSRKLREDNYPK